MREIKGKGTLFAPDGRTHSGSSLRSTAHRPDLAERGGINEIDIPLHQLGERRFRSIFRVTPHQFEVVHDIPHHGTRQTPNRTEIPSSCNAGLQTGKLPAIPAPPFPLDVMSKKKNKF